VLLNVLVLRQFFTLCFLQHHAVILTVLILFACFAYCTGESSFEVKIESDSNDITEHPHDDRPRPYLCIVCDKRFTLKGDLKRHKQIHAREKLYLCTHCEKRFATDKYLKQHLNVHSSKYKCTECGKCFGSNHNLTEHRRSHSGGKPFECTVCSKRFSTSGDLVKHSRIQSGEKPHKCPECDKVFSRSGDLTKHMRVHTGDKPYKCSLCDKSFSTSSYLQLHKRQVHSNRRPYDCRYCGKMFKSSHHLKRHVYIHTGAKPYSCRHCSDCFRRRHHLKRICWSHTMKVLGSHAIFVRRNSAKVVTLRSIYFAMKMLSHMFAVNVQWVSLEKVNCDDISWNTQTINSFAVVHVVNISSVKTMSLVTSTDVLLNWDMSISLLGKIETENKQSVDNCLLDRVAAVDSRLASEIHTQIQTAATRCVFEH